MLRASMRRHPLRRIGEPVDVVSAIEWLLDPAQSWVTGVVIPVDGGLSRILPSTRVSKDLQADGDEAAPILLRGRLVLPACHSIISPASSG